MLAIAGQRPGRGRRRVHPQGTRPVGREPVGDPVDRAHERIPQGGEVGNLILSLPGTSPGRGGSSRPTWTRSRCVPGRCRSVAAVHRSRVEVYGLGRRRPRRGDGHLGRRDRNPPPSPAAPAAGVPWTVQEELGLLRARHLQIGLLGKPRLAFNFDGGSPADVTLGATGGYRMRIRVTGIASHAGVAPEKGVSAIAIASLAIANLHRDGWHGRLDKTAAPAPATWGSSAAARPPTSSPHEVLVHAEARSHDPAFRAEIVAAIDRAFRPGGQSVRNVEGSRRQGGNPRAARLRGIPPRSR